MSNQNVIQVIASCVQARTNCEVSNNIEWFEKHSDRIEKLVKEYLPSGSGFNSGTKIDLDVSNESRIVFTTSFHHMNEHGYYDGWTEHKITVRPSFSGFDLTISGRDRNAIKDYIGDVFQNALSKIVF